MEHFILTTARMPNLSLFNYFHHDPNARDVLHSWNSRQAGQMNFTQPSKVGRTREHFESQTTGKTPDLNQAGFIVPVPLKKGSVFNHATASPFAGNCRSCKSTHLGAFSIIILCLLMVFSGPARSQDSNAIHLFPAREKADSVQYPKTVHRAIMNSLLHTLVPTGLGALSLASASISLQKEITCSNIAEAVGGVVLTSYGLFIGPSAGDIYAHDYASAYLGILARVTGVYMIIHYSSTSYSSKPMVALGGILFIGSTVYNIVSCRSAVKKYNQVHVGNTSLSIAPNIDCLNSNYGFAINVRFK